MRVIAGCHRGRKIETIAGKEIRPTTAIAREAIFNILGHGEFGGRGGHFLEGYEVLDLYTGCGALAMEAFSRGASHVTLMDIKPEHLTIARQNIAKIHESENATFIRCDSSNPPPAPRPCDVVFVDPPYKDKLVDRSIERLISNGWVKEGSIIVIEMDKHGQYTAPDSLEEIKNRTYGLCRIVVLRVVSCP